tara:strand:+ start:2178 stop:2873 length:696 start_codon:yes stop_codon:yes gene_type:complete
MSKSPKISVLMSVFNAEKSIEKSINSILNQSYENFELLIMDDKSTDNTGQILNSYSSFDERIKIYENMENIGLTKSLNILINKAQGEYLARQDSDDESDIRRFEKQINFIESRNLLCCTTRSISIQNKKRKIPGFSFYIPQKISIKYKNPFIHGTLMINASLLKDLGGYDEKFKYSQDYKLFLDLIKKGITISTINEPLYFLNTIDNISVNNKNEQEYYFRCAKKGIIPRY